jgi:hypothetical protein
VIGLLVMVLVVALLLVGSLVAGVVGVLYGRAS